MSDTLLAEQPQAPDPRSEAAGTAESSQSSTSERGFSVSLDEFSGPFDLLLSLIAKHKLDVTVLALSQVTDEFISHIRARGPEWDLDEATEFLVIAATLLDLKAARLLPSGEVDDEDDLALLEARDLLFARLLQYRAFREIASYIQTTLSREAGRRPRSVGLDPQFAALLPEVLLGVGPVEFSRLAARALTPRIEPLVSLAHIHAPRVSVREQAAILIDRLRRHPTSTFRALTGDAESTLVVVARFLALLDLFREGVISFDQVTPLGELYVRWHADPDTEIDITFEHYDDNPSTNDEPIPSEPISDEATHDVPTAQEQE